MKTVKKILLVMATLIVLIVSVGIVWIIKTTPEKPAEPKVNNAITTPPSQHPEPQKLLVKAGQKAYLPTAFNSKSLTWGLKEYGPRVTVTIEEGDGVFLIPDGKGGFTESKSFSYANGEGEIMPVCKGTVGNRSFQSDQDLTILYQWNY